MSTTGMSFIIAIVLLMVSQGFLVIGANTFNADRSSPMRRVYLATCFFLAMWSGFYGLMTLVDHPALTKLFWVVGFINMCVFFPCWLHFHCYLTGWHIARQKALIAFAYLSCAILGLACVTFGEVQFVATGWGNQFSCEGIIFKVAFVYFCLIVFAFTYIEAWWRKNAQIKRQRVQATTFLIATLAAIPIGVPNVFIIPGFLHGHTTPITPIGLFFVSLIFYRTMRVNKGLNITVENAANEIFSTVILPVMLLDPHNTVVHANAAAFGMWCAVDGGIVGKDAAALIPVQGRDIFIESAAGLIVEVPVASGIRICDMQVAVTKDQYDDVIDKVVVLHDITDMRQALEQAQAGNRAKTDFLSRMSHEIRTPLNAITGMMHINKKAIETNDTAKALASTDGAILASKHLLGVINDVLDMSKIEAGKFEISHEPFHLIAAMNEVVSIISVRCRDRELIFDHNIAELPAVWLCGDKLRLKQVLINILGNAVKFTPAGGTITMDIQAVEQGENTRLAFALFDNGIGMSQDFLQRVFDPFEQADAGKRSGGTGLGLPISRTLVNLMGGDIVVESKPGEGSVFRFEIVLSVAEVGQENGSCCDIRNYDFTGKRILLAEDIEVNRIILKELFAETGVTIDEAEDGQRALEIFVASPANHYDLILMDVQMPNMDGYEATQNIRALVRSDAKIIPIIAMTANAYQEDVDNAIKAGMNEHLSKPIDIEIVMRTLAIYLDLKL